jgi:pimeloyl-ACP methyl ester carboxylesterase
VTPTRTLTCLSADGVHIAYDDIGAGDKPFILVHGWCCDRSTMAPLASHLAETYRRRVINLDLRGFGGSDKPTGPYRSDDFVSDILSVAREAGINNAVLIGHSMGGRVSLALSQRDPAFPEALILLDSAIVEAPDYVATRRAQLDQPDWHESLRARMGRMFLEPDHSPAREQILSRAASIPQEVAIAALEAADEIDTAAALRDCQRPVLYIGASSPRETQSTLHGLNRDLVYAQVARSGHFVQLDAPHEVEASIDRFIRGLPAGRTDLT